MEVVGIDVAKRKFDLAWLQADSGKLRSKVFDNGPTGFKQLLEWLKKQGIAPADWHIAMEATSQYYEALAFILHDAGYKVSVVNPLRIKAFGESLLRRQKTDRADAELIARFCAQNQPEQWTPAPAEIRELQRLLARLEAVKQMHVQEQNRRHEAEGIALESVERMIASLKAEENRLKRMIKDHIDHHPGLREQKKLLCSIPGVGDQLSSHFLAWLRPERFDSVRQAVAFIGLSPRHHESGDSVRGATRLSKLGHARLRKILYLPALAAIRCNPAAKAMANRLKAVGKRPKVAVVAVMRKLVHWMLGVLKSGIQFDPTLALAKG